MNSKGKVNNERLYALDGLRATILLRGLVLHVACSFVVADYGAAWPYKDFETNTKVADHLVAFIHIFRMPVFYILAGFFAALLFYRRGAQELLINRVQRILVPFVIGLLILYPLGLFGAGIFLGWLWLHYESIWLVTLAHGSLNNWGQLAFKYMKEPSNVAGTENLLTFTAVNLALLIAGIFFVFR